MVMVTKQQERERDWLARRKDITLSAEPTIVQDSNMWLRLATDEPARWFWSEYEAERGY